MVEAGLPGFVAVAWFGIVGPAGMTQPVVARLSKASLGTLETKEVKDRLFASGVEVRTGSPDEFLSLIKSEIDKWGPIIKKAGVYAD